MTVELKDVLVALIEQRNEALNKLAESMAQNRSMSQELQTLTTWQDNTKEKDDSDEAQTETS
jgi:hypothetical protein